VGKEAAMEELRENFFECMMLTVLCSGCGGSALFTAEHAPNPLTALVMGVAGLGVALLACAVVFGKLAVNTALNRLAERKNCRPDATAWRDNQPSARAAENARR
jgi:hypothetical protein